MLVLYPWERKAIEKQGIELALGTNTEGATATELAARQEATGFTVFQGYDGPDGIQARSRSPAVPGRRSRTRMDAQRR